MADQLLELVLEDLDRLLVLLQDPGCVHLLVLLDAVQHSELDVPPHLLSDIPLLLDLVQLDQSLVGVLVDIPSDWRQLIDFAALDHLNLLVRDFQDVSMGQSW